MSKHCSHVFNSLKEILIHYGCVNNGRQTDGEKKQRKLWTKKWNAHVEKHGNTPYVVKCTICSGKELKDDIKHGSYNPPRPTKAERDENKF